MTIDRLILRQLSDGYLLSPKEIAATWGEDRRRVQGWLDKFVKLGLAVGIWIDEHERALFVYYGYYTKIREFLKNSPSRVSHFG